MLKAHNRQSQVKIKHTMKRTNSDEEITYSLLLLTVINISYFNLLFLYISDIEVLLHFYQVYKM